MRYPQVLVYEQDGRLAGFLRAVSAKQNLKWALREPRRLESCMQLLARGGPNVLVLKVGTDLVRELTLLERVNYLFPDTATVVVGDTDNPLLAGLLWDLGATLVLFPPLSRLELPAVVAQLLGLTSSAPVSPDHALSSEPLDASEADTE
jgi:hypothetical protein